MTLQFKGLQFKGQGKERGGLATPPHAKGMGTAESTTFTTEVQTSRLHVTTTASGVSVLPSCSRMPPGPANTCSGGARRGRAQSLIVRSRPKAPQAALRPPAPHTSAAGMQAGQGRALPAPAPPHLQRGAVEGVELQRHAAVGQVLWQQLAVAGHSHPALHDEEQQHLRERGQGRARAPAVRLLPPPLKGAVECGPARQRPALPPALTLRACCSVSTSATSTRLPSTWLHAWLVGANRVTVAVGSSSSGTTPVWEAREAARGRQGRRAAHGWHCTAGGVQARRRQLAPGAVPGMAP